MVFCDTHIHLLAPEWQQPVVARLAVARQAGIELLLQPGVRFTGWDELIALANNSPAVYAAPGLHPMCAGEWNVDVEKHLRELGRHPRVLAIGEVGLDAALDVDLSLQEQVFRAQLGIALETGLPVLIHCRNKTAETLGILHETGAQRSGGIWHGFSGSYETAQQILGLGFLLGIGPVLLRENARKLPAVVQMVPAEALVIETDAPDMAAGPEVLLKVAEKLAALRGWTLAETARITTANARRILHVKDKEESE